VLKNRYKIINYLFVLLILFFLSKYLYNNWSQVRGFPILFNYYYLIISFLLLFISFVGMSFTWYRILNIIDKNFFSPFIAFKIYIYSFLGRYVPGKIWTVVGKVYLGSKEGANKKSLAVSSFLDSVLSLMATSTLGIIFLLVSIDFKFLNIILLPALIVIIGLIFIHPKIFYTIFNFLLKRTKRSKIVKTEFLSYYEIIKSLLLYILCSLSRGAAFLFFIISLYPNVSAQNFTLVIGAFLLANAIGVAALFAPSGLGVREGILALILGIIFPVTIAIFISFLARLWMTASELLLFSIVSICSFLKRNNKLNSHV